MVEVTQTNFDLISKRIERLLPWCCYVSIDLEFTGLRDNNNENGRFINKNDLPSQRYMKQRELIHNFCMIQFGICLWKNELNDKSSASKMTAYPFNFWTFRQDSNSTFLSQSSTLKFLRENGFDFNKLIDEGIDFLSIDQEKKERKYYEKNKERKRERLKQREQKKEVIKPEKERDIQFIQEIEEKFEKFVNNKQENEENEEILDLGLMNGFRRLLIYQLIDTKYNESLIAFKENIENNKYLKKIIIKKITKKDSKENIENEEEKKKEKKWNDNIFESIGVRAIFDMICLYKIPILFHNGLLDSMHFYQSFIGSLPLDPCIFTKRLNEYLPFIYDTKYMMNILFVRTKQIEHCSLDKCFLFFMDKNNNDIDKILNIDVCIEMNEKNKERNTKKENEFLYSNNGSFHVAGYDAFCTGYIFAKIGAYLYLLNNKNDNKNIYDIKNELHSNDCNKMMTLSHYANRLNLPYNFCKYFYVGNRYKIDDKFNFNLKYKQNGKNLDDDDDDNKNDDIFNGTLCGVDYNAINDEWYKMFHCKIIINTDSMHSMIDRLILEFLKEFISERKRIMIYKERGNIEAKIRINNISENEYDKIYKAFTSKQPNKLIFSKYIDYKSKELRECYKRIN